MGTNASVFDDGGDTVVIPALSPWNESPRDLAGLGIALGFRSDAAKRLNGLRAMLERYPETQESFFAVTLPSIVMAANAFGEVSLPKLRQRVEGATILKRADVHTLLARIFLGDPFEKSTAMPDNTFRHLFAKAIPAEIAKLRMFVNYFDRCREEAPQGNIEIYRHVRPQMLTEDGKPTEDAEAAWASCAEPLLPMDVEEMWVGFEDARGGDCLHADFANMMIGGGVLSGGCVQEEIRFAICPELVVAMLFCPCILPNESIQIVGAEQFSAYAGYGPKLRYAGDFRDPSRRDPDGTVWKAITAMDAYDFRSTDSSFEVQAGLQVLVRDLEKAAAAFEPAHPSVLSRWPLVATGNWGCGAFGGYVPVKAVVQWLAASSVRRHLRYFPFNEPVGPKLREFTAALSGPGEPKATVGGVFRALMHIGSSRHGGEAHPRRPSPEKLSGSLEIAAEEGFPSYEDFFDALLAEVRNGTTEKKVARTDNTAS
jgi:hypothetical protein